MSLYIRLSTNFFSHVKTLRLKAILGNDALWIPPRLWVYAAEHQPDGNLSSYTAEELAMLITYTGDAQAMLQALLKVRFLDARPIRIHGWTEHNGFHKSFSERASKAAKARWKGQEKKVHEMKGDEMTEALPQALLAASNGTVSASTQAILDQKALERVELELKRISDSVESHQSLSPEDRLRKLELKTRAKSLKTKLNFV